MKDGRFLKKELKMMKNIKFLQQFIGMKLALMMKIFLIQMKKPV
jgi:hypothetical protein